MDRTVMLCRFLTALVTCRRLMATILPGVLLAVSLSVPAQAHVLGGVMGGFGSGFQHPLLGFDHFLAMAAVGLWGAQMGGRAVWTLPATFPMIMCIGGIFGMLDVMPASYVGIGIALSLVVLGGCIAAAWKAPEAIALLIITFFALFHGYAHGQALPLAIDPAAFAVGFVVSTGLIHILGIAVGLLFNRVYEGRITRALGGVITLYGVYSFFA